MQWWVVPTVSGLTAGYMIVQGTAASIHAKYGTIGIMGPYATKAAAQAAAKGNVGQGPSNIAVGSGQLGFPTDLLHGMNWGNWFLRGGELILGVVLVGVGVAKVTGTTNLISQAVKAKI